MIPYISCVKKDGYTKDILNSDKKRDAATATSLHFSITLILISRMSLLVSGRTSDKPEDAILTIDDGTRTAQH